jgi:hypothetical protein
LEGTVFWRLLDSKIWDLSGKNIRISVEVYVALMQLRFIYFVCEVGFDELRFDPDFIINQFRRLLIIFVFDKRKRQRFEHSASDRSIFQVVNSDCFKSEYWIYCEE